MRVKYKAIVQTIIEKEIEAESMEDADNKLFKSTDVELFDGATKIIDAKVLDIKDADIVIRDIVVDATFSFDEKFITEEDLPAIKLLPTTITSLKVANVSIDSEEQDAAISDAIYEFLQTQLKSANLAAAQVPVITDLNYSIIYEQE